MKKGIVALVLGAMLLGAIAVPAYAEDSASRSKAKAAGMSVSINQGGQARIEGKVVSFSGNTLVVSSWGSNWTATFAADAQVQARLGGKLPIAAIKAGDDVILSGKVAANNMFVVTSPAVRDLSLSAQASATSTADGRYIITLKDGRTVTVSVGSATGATSTISNGELRNFFGIFQKFFGSKAKEIGRAHV